MTVHEKSQSVANGNSLTIEAETYDNDAVYVFVDDGSGGAPVSHDFSVEFAKDNSGTAYMEWDSTTGSTSKQNSEYPAIENQVQVSVTNQSGASATLRVRVVTESE